MELPRFAAFELVALAAVFVDAVAAGFTPGDPKDNGGADANEGAAAVVVVPLGSDARSGAFPRLANALLLLLDGAGADAVGVAALLFCPPKRLEALVLGVLDSANFAFESPKFRPGFWVSVACGLGENSEGALDCPLILGVADWPPMFVNKDCGASGWDC